MADFKQELAKYKQAIDKELEIFFKKNVEKFKEEDPLVGQFFEHAQKIVLAGGKRIRGALVCSAYFGAGGMEKKKIVKIAAAIELVHLFLLIHDDVIDNGKIRHGEQTMQEYFSKKVPKKFSGKFSSHYGNSVAIIAGDMVYVKALELAAGAGFSPEVTCCVIFEMQKIVANTIIGQSQDFAFGFAEKISVENILLMYKNKTAKYTFEGPLHLGLMLAGCNDKKVFNAVTNYAINLGIAFQIQDDILGIFENEKATGKSTVSDIEEGKQTYLVAVARKHSNPVQIKKMNNIFGKKNISEAEAESFREIIRSTGSLEKANALAHEMIHKGKQYLEKMMLLKKHKEFLSGLALYLEERSKKWQ